ASLPSTGGNHVNAASPTLGAESDRGAIRRKGRLAVVIRMVGQPARLAALGGLNPNIEIAAAGAIRSVRNVGSIGGDGGLGVKSRIVRYSADLPSDDLIDRRGVLPDMSPKESGRGHGGCRRQRRHCDPCEAAAASRQE